MSPLLAQIPPPPVNGIQLGPVDLRLYGVLIAVGAYLALRLAVRRYHELGGDEEVAERTALWVLGAGFVGARIGYVIPRLTSGGPGGEGFLADPLAIPAIWEGGLALFGGMFLGTVAGVLVARRSGADVPALADAIAPALPLAQAIGRWGNYFNQELYGRPTEVPWALEVEAPFRRPGFESFETFHPTFLYESLSNLVLFVVLLRLDRTGRLRRGSLLFCYAIGYGVIRAATESIRIDTAERYFGLSRNSWVAFAVILIGLVGLRWWERRGRSGDAADAEEDAPDTGPADAETDGTRGRADDGVDDPAAASPTSEDEDPPR